MTLNPADALALFLAAWLIYLSDRLLDSCSLQDADPRSLRHEFCLRHRRIWIGAMILIAALNLGIVWLYVNAETARAGVVVGLLVSIYLILNHFSGQVWRWIAVKEIVIGFLFAAGTLVALLPSPSNSGSLWFAAMGFAALCSLNCICIAFWEHDLDVAQAKVSMATCYPAIEQHLIKISIGLVGGFVAGIFVWPEATPIYGSAAVSALLLALLNSSRWKIDRDDRTALADLVLLTPLLACLLTNA